MSIKILTIILVFSLIIGCSSAKDTGSAPLVEYLNSPLTAGKGRPFSEAVRVGNLLILSGQIGIDPETGALAPGGIAAETKQAMENIKSTLQRFGSSLGRVVKCTVMLADIKEWPKMNKVYVTYFPEHLPARSAFGTSGLAMGARLEIECWAVLEAASEE